MAESDGLHEPVVLGGLHTIAPLLGFAIDPMRAAARLQRRHGDFVHLRFPCAIGRMPSSVVFTAAAVHFRDILGDPRTWRTVNIAAAGRRGHASSRLSRGLVRMRGRRHDHYRRLITPPLRRASVMAMDESLAGTALSVCARWPRDQTVDLLALSRDMMQHLAAVHLFGRDAAVGCEIARMISTYVAASWSLPINLCRLDLPGTPFRRFLRHSEALEERVLAWAASKRGTLDPQDLLSIIVNNPDEDGGRPSDSVIAGHVPTLFGAAYETCQNALAWLLILIGQHPQVERKLRDELAGALGRGPPVLEAVADLPFLGAVVKEGLRILPPVPNQYRVATQDARLSQVRFAAGTRAILSAFLRNRDPALYAQPDRFLPGRWEAINPSPFQYAVFSAGPRACPGFRFGQAVLKVALAAILSQHRVVVEQGARVGYRVGVALVPYPGVPGRLAAPGGSGPPPGLRGNITQLVRFPE